MGKRKMDRAMVEAWAGADDADAIALVLDASRPLPKETELVLAGLQNRAKPVILVLNKVDAVRHEKLLELTEQLNKQYDFHDTFMVSALKKTGWAPYWIVFLRSCQGRLALPRRYGG